MLGYVNNVFTINANAPLEYTTLFARVEDIYLQNDIVRGAHSCHMPPIEDS